MNKHEEIMSSLKGKLSKIHAEIPKGSNVIYFDYPMHFNIGDLLIYLGTESFFKESNYNVIGRYTLYDAYNKKIEKKISDKTYIICHGGGNFGDIYPFCQNLREHIITHYPRNKVVILPQSCYFAKKEEEERSSEIFRKHRNVVIYTRDQKSLDIAKKFSDKVFLMPDMAHHLWNDPVFKSSENIQNKSCILSRTDKEVGDNIVRDNYADNFDWFDLITSPQEIKRKALSLILLSFGRKLDLNNYSSQIWLSIAKDAVLAGIVKINQYDKVTTNRLHGHIMSMLLSKENHIVDNMYGKNSSYVRSWTYQSPLVTIKNETKAP